MPDDLEVALAVRMSMSIPIFFEPVRVKHPETEREHITLMSLFMPLPLLVIRAGANIRLDRQIRKDQNEGRP